MMAASNVHGSESELMMKANFFAKIYKDYKFQISFLLTISLTLSFLLCAHILIDTIIGNALPYPNEDEIVVAERHFSVDDREASIYALGPAAADHWLHNIDSLSDLTLTVYERANVNNLSKQPSIGISFVSGNYFKLFSTTLTTGNDFRENVDGIIVSHKAVVTESFVKEQGLDKSTILGQTLNISGVAYTVAGVMSPSFKEPLVHGYSRKTDVWVPYSSFPSRLEKIERWDLMEWKYKLFGRCKACNYSEVERDLIESYGDKWRSHPLGATMLSGWVPSAKLEHISKYIIGDFSSTKSTIIIAVLALVLVGLSNLFNLYVLYISSRFKDSAIKMALGVSKFELFWSHYFKPILLLTILGAIFSAIIGFIFVDFSTYLSALLPRMSEMRFSFQSFSVLAFVVIVVSMLLSIAGFFLQSKNKAILFSSEKSVGNTLSKWVGGITLFFQSYCLVIILAIPVMYVMYSSTSLLKRTTYDASQTYMIEFNDNSQAHREAIPERIAFIKRKIKSHFSEIDAISATYDDPLNTLNRSGVNSINSNDGRFHASTIRGDADLFNLLNVDLVDGRLISQQELLSQSKVAVISKSLSERLYPDKSAIGEVAYVHWDKSPWKIIGVVEDLVKYGKHDPKYEMYMTISHEKFNYLFRVKNQNKPPSHEIWVNFLNDISFDGSVISYKQLEEKVSETSFVKKMSFFLSFITVSFSFLVGILGFVGVIGILLNFSSREFKTRIIIGSSSWSIYFLAFKKVVLPAVLGLVLGSISLKYLFSLYRNRFWNIYEHLDVSLYLTLFVVFFLVVMVSFFRVYKIIDSAFRKTLSDS